MKVELHLHTSRHSSCADASPGELMARLIQTRYDAVYITEHECVWSDFELSELQAEFPRIKIFPGMELTLPGAARSLHLLVLGSNDAEYLTIQHDPAAVLAKAKAAGHLTVLAHPFRWPGATALLDNNLCPDAIEFRTGNHKENMSTTVPETANRLGLKMLNSGDVHALTMINRFWIETTVALESATDIRNIVLSNQYKLHATL